MLWMWTALDLSPALPHKGDMDVAPSATSSAAPSAAEEYLSTPSRQSNVVVARSVSKLVERWFPSQLVVF